VKTRTRRAAETLLTILAALTIRWAFLDAYVVPSGSMLPSLLIGDRMFVAKFVYGVRIPFTTTWLARWATPARGDVVILRDPEDAARILVKRVVGHAGAGKLVFSEENFLTRMLHNQAAFAIQRRLQLKGLQMIVLPVRAI
jgi:signal peptidase I